VPSDNGGSRPEASCEAGGQGLARIAAIRSFRFSKLPILIHPDKQPNDSNATRRFQDTQTFYVSCCALLNTKPKKKNPKGRTSPRSVNIPHAFHVQDKWPFLSDVTAAPILPTGADQTEHDVARTIAYKCINYRGAIAHGKCTGLVYRYAQVSASARVSASKVLESFGGAKLLESVDDIKAEIMANGPVISTSFLLMQVFLNACEHCSSFSSSLKDECHALLIVGWKVSSFGEMWLVRSIRGNNDIPIAIGQYSIEEDVIAPKSDLFRNPWQPVDRSFDVDLSGFDWYTWTGISTNIDSTKLEPLFKALGCSWAKALNLRKRFYIREKGKEAKSREAYLTNIEWMENKMWKISATFCD